MTAWDFVPLIGLPVTCMLLTGLPGIISYKHDGLGPVHYNWTPCKLLTGLPEILSYINWIPWDSTLQT